MKKYIPILLLLPFVLFSQQKNYTIVNSNKQAIPYVKIHFDEKNGIYSDDKGSFSIDKSKYKSISISHFEYDTLSVSLKDIRNDSITIFTKEETLEDIVLKIYNEKELYKQRTSDKNKLKLISYVFGKYEYITHIKSKKNYKTLVWFHLPITIDKEKVKKQNLSDITIDARLTIYNKNKELIYSQGKQFDAKSIQNKLLQFNIQHSSDKIGKEFYIGIEFLSIHNSEKAQVDNVIGLPFARTKKNEESTYFIHPFYMKDSWNAINDRNFHHPDEDANSSYVLMGNLFFDL